MFKNLCSGVGARKELKEFAKQSGVKQDNLCLTTLSGEGEAKKELAEFVKQNCVKQYECRSGSPRDFLNYVVKNEVAAFDVTEKMCVYDVKW